MLTSANGVKSIQTGMITLNAGAGSNTATITAVNTAKCVLLSGGIQSATTTLSDALISITLTNSTTITANRQSSSTAAYINWTLIEYA